MIQVRPTCPPSPLVNACLELSMNFTHSQDVEASLFAFVCVTERDSESHGMMPFHLMDEVVTGTEFRSPSSYRKDPFFLFSDFGCQWSCGRHIQQSILALSPADGQAGKGRWTSRYSFFRDPGSSKDRQRQRKEDTKLCSSAGVFVQKQKVLCTYQQLLRKKTHANLRSASSML